MVSARFPARLPDTATYPPAVGVGPDAPGRGDAPPAATSPIAGSPPSEKSPVWPIEEFVSWCGADHTPPGARSTAKISLSAPVKATTAVPSEACAATTAAPSVMGETMASGSPATCTRMPSSAAHAINRSVSASPPEVNRVPTPPPRAATDAREGRLTTRHAPLPVPRHRRRAVGTHRDPRLEEEPARERRARNGTARRDDRAGQHRPLGPTGGQPAPGRRDPPARRGRQGRHLRVATQRDGRAERSTGPPHDQPLLVGDHGGAVHRRRDRRAAMRGEQPLPRPVADTHLDKAAARSDDEIARRGDTRDGANRRVKRDEHLRPRRSDQQHERREDESETHIPGVPETSETAMRVGRPSQTRTVPRDPSYARTPENSPERMSSTTAAMSRSMRRSPSRNATCARTNACASRTFGLACSIPRSSRACASAIR